MRQFLAVHYLNRHQWRLLRVTIPTSKCLEMGKICTEIFTSIGGAANRVQPVITSNVGTACQRGVQNWTKGGCSTSCHCAFANISNCNINMSHPLLTTVLIHTLQKDSHRITVSWTCFPWQSKGRFIPLIFETLNWRQNKAELFPLRESHFRYCTVSSVPCGYCVLVLWPYTKNIPS